MESGPKMDLALSLGERESRSDASTSRSATGEGSVPHYCVPVDR